MSESLRHLNDPAPEAPIRYIQRFAVKGPDRIAVVDVKEIDWIEGARDYIRLHCGPRSHLIRTTMTSVASRLDPDQFVRIHRSTIVRIDRVKELSPLFSGDYAVTLTDGTELRMSRTYRRGAHERLGFGF